MRLLLATIMFSLSACDSASTTEEFCTRADSCNTLNGSVDECIEDFDSLLDQLTPSERDEFLYDLQSCLDRPSCVGFKSCVLSERTSDSDSTINELELTVR